MDIIMPLLYKIYKAKTNRNIDGEFPTVSTDNNGNWQYALFAL